MSGCDAFSDLKFYPRLQLFYFILRNKVVLFKITEETASVSTTGYQQRPKISDIQIIAESSNVKCCEIAPRVILHNKDEHMESDLHPLLISTYNKSLLYYVYSGSEGIKIHADTENTLPDYLRPPFLITESGYFFGGAESAGKVQTITTSPLTNIGVGIIPRFRSTVYSSAKIVSQRANGITETLKSWIDPGVKPKELHIAKDELAGNVYVAATVSKGEGVESEFFLSRYEWRDSSPIVRDLDNECLTDDLPDLKNPKHHRLVNAEVVHLPYETSGILYLTFSSGARVVRVPKQHSSVPSLMYKASQSLDKAPTTIIWRPQGEYDRDHQVSTAALESQQDTNYLDVPQMHMMELQQENQYNELISCHTTLDTGLFSVSVTSRLGSTQFLNYMLKYCFARPSDRILCPMDECLGNRSVVSHFLSYSKWSECSRQARGHARQPILPNSWQDERISCWDQTVKDLYYEPRRIVAVVEGTLKIVFQLRLVDRVYHSLSLAEQSNPIWKVKMIILIRLYGELEVTSALIQLLAFPSHPLILPDQSVHQKVVSPQIRNKGFRFLTRWSCRSTFSSNMPKGNPSIFDQAFRQLVARTLCIVWKPNISSCRNHPYLPLVAVEERLQGLLAFFHEVTQRLDQNKTLNNNNVSSQQPPYHRSQSFEFETELNYLVSFLFKDLSVGDKTPANSRLDETPLLLKRAIQCIRLKHEMEMRRKQLKGVLDVTMDSVRSEDLPDGINGVGSMKSTIAAVFMFGLTEAELENMRTNPEAQIKPLLDPFNGICTSNTQNFVLCFHQ